MLTDGLAVVRMANASSSESNFVVWLERSNGRSVDLLANAIGPYTGSRAVHAPVTGNYYLNVTSDTTWTINVTQPHKKSAPKTRSFSGNAPKATGLFTLKKGAYTFKWDSEGEDNFIVWLLDRKGNPVGLVANKIGPTTGRRRVRIPKTGQYIMDVQASGPWTVRLKR